MSTNYSSVVFQKRTGRLLLDANGLCYESVEGKAASLEESCRRVAVAWKDVVKHQVSPATHPKPLLRLLLTTSTDLTFQLESREALERIRRDISDRLRNAQLEAAATHGHTRKRTLAEADTDPSQCEDHNGQYIHSLTRLNPDLVAIARSSLLASDVTLRNQHSHLVLSSPSCNTPLTNHTPSTSILSESDFWNTHHIPLSYHAAKIYGIAEPGRSSTIRSSLDILSTSISSYSACSTAPKPTTSTTTTTSTTHPSDHKQAGITIHPKSSSRSKVISLGVEEIREIFLMYPAVHKAYEDKVPLELSEEQFWTKYLASEFFHRDRGRLGSHFRNRDEYYTGHKTQDREDRKRTAPSTTTGGKPEDPAHLALASTADMFSRLDMDIQQEQARQKQIIRKSLGTAPLAVGQFDLASTLHTERGGKLLLLQHHGMEGIVSPAWNINDSSTISAATSSLTTTTAAASTTTITTTGDRIIDKYNRHWAITLNPNEAHAGSSSMALARQSIHHVVDGDEDAQCGGGVDSEMQRLVRFASAKEDQVDHVRCEGVVVDTNEPSRSTGHGQEDRSTTQSILYKDLNLKNIGVYAGCFHPDIMDDTTTTDRTRSTTAPSRHVLFSKLMMERMKGVMNPDANEPKPTRLDATAAALPEPSFGREILKALTKRMVEDSITEEDAIKITQGLPDDFKQQVASYFRRCSELLRHFFALRRVIELEKMSPSPQGTDRLLIKSKKIIKAMEDVYREMESIRNGFPVTAVGETMRKIYLSIMNQLDWAFKLNRDSSSTGGFVSVDD